MAKPIDLTGKRFGKWTVNELAYKKNYDKYYLCTCDCGTKKIVLSHNLTKGLSKSCGCSKHKPAPNYRDRTGEKYWKLTCIEPKRVGHIVYWRCKCDCGNETWVRSTNLTSGAVKSCGCASDHVNAVHGMSHTRIHGIWGKILYRCYNENCAHFKDYGGRGITVCDEWHGTDGFIRFMDWSMEHGYSDELTIDRIDVNGNYEPGNCRWVNRVTQMNNTRANKRFTYNGETRTIAEWSREYGIDYSTLEQRLRVLKWPIEKALTQEVRRIGVK